MTPASVSVVIPCFNQGRFLADAIGSVLNQTQRVDEVIVIDDGSSDNTREITSGFVSVRYVRQANQGLAAARNAGIRASTAGYMVFLDADDVLEPCAVSLGAAHLNAHPDW